MKEEKPGRVKIAGFIVMALLVLIDQLTKYAAATRLADAPKVIIPGVFELTYVRNYGAAFGILQNARSFFIAVTLIMIAIIVIVLRKVPDRKRYHALTIALFVLMAGATGNLIDRMMHTYVVDFLYFSLIDFPVFNAADIFVVCSVIFLIILMLFVYKKDDDLAFLKPEGKESKEEKKE